MTQDFQRHIVVGRSVVWALGLLVLGTALTRGDGRGDLARQRIHLELGLLATAAGSATYPSGSLVGDLAVGESQVWSLVVGLDRYRRGGAAACSTNVADAAAKNSHLASAIGIRSGNSFGSIHPA